MPLPVRRALLSVSDKSGLIELARGLTARGIEILSTGGTAKLLTAHGVPGSWMGASRRCTRRSMADSWVGAGSMTP